MNEEKVLSNDMKKKKKVEMRNDTKLKILESWLKYKFTS